MTLTEKTRPALAVPYAMERPDRVPSRRYYDPEFYAMECELLWPHVWQIACREEQVASPGEFFEYTIGDETVVIVRAGSGALHAFYNTCLHRGRRLADGCGSFADEEIREIELQRCPSTRRYSPILT